ncbi:hypothetical protein T484DRAFT_1849424 [Baffinella frigidus]|nr:hypothetical protein T484DRAFT_1849424 [Cryptophyta sp. CCMP2293]
MRLLRSQSLVLISLVRMVSALAKAETSDATLLATSDPNNAKPLAKAETSDATLLAFILDLALQIEQSAWNGQSVSNLLNAVARLHELSFASAEQVANPT